MDIKKKREQKGRAIKYFEILYRSLWRLLRSDLISVLTMTFEEHDMKTAFKSSPILVAIGLILFILFKNKESKFDSC